MYKERIKIIIDTEKRNRDLEEEIKTLLIKNKYRVSCTDYTHSKEGLILYFTKDK